MASSSQPTLQQQLAAAQEQIQWLNEQNLQMNGELSRLRASNPQTSHIPVSTHQPRSFFPQNQPHVSQQPFVQPQISQPFVQPQVSQPFIQPQVSQVSLPPPPPVNNSRPIFPPLPSGEIVRKLEKYKTGSFSDREVKVLAPPRLIFKKVPAFYQLSAAKMKFSAAKLAFALTRRFQNLPKIGVGFLSVSRRERLLGERETASGPSFKYCSQPSVPYAFLDRKIQKKGQLYQLVSGLEGESITANLLEPFEEPEREFRKRNKKTRANKVRPRALIFEMGEEAPMWTARRGAPTVPTNPITKPNLNKEIPGKLLHMIKDLTFDGKNDSNPIVHLENFVDICDLFKTDEGRDDAIRLRDCVPIFFSRFFPPSKIDKLKADIRSFQQDDGETISEAWERFKHLLNSCPSHGLTKSEQVQTFYSGLAYSSRATLDSSAGGVFMYKTPTEGYKLLEDMLIHNIDWRTDKRLQIPRMAGKISTDFDPSDEIAAVKNQQVKFERKIDELIKSVHALQVGCEECKGPHLTKDCPNRPMMTPEEVNSLNRGDYQGRWNNNRNFNPRPPGFFEPNQPNQRTEGEPRISIEDRLIQFMDAQKKINDEVGSYLHNHQSIIQNLELQVGRIAQTLAERTQRELPTQTQVNPKVENAKPMLMMAGTKSKKAWTDIYNKKYVDSDSESEPDYATDYDSEGFTISFEHLKLNDSDTSSDDENEDEDGKQGGYAEFVIPKKEKKGKEKEKEKPDKEELIYIAPIKHDPGSYSLPISCSKYKGLALIDSGAALNMMPSCFCRKMGIKKIEPTDYQYRGVNGYMTKPLGIAEAVPIRIGNFVYYTDFIIANLPKDTEIPIILGRAFLHTAQVNTDMRNQVTSMGYGENRLYFDPNGEPVRHLDEPYEDPSLTYKKVPNRPLLPHEQMGRKKTEDYPNPMQPKEISTNPGPSKKEHRKKRGNHSEGIEAKIDENRHESEFFKRWKQKDFANAKPLVWRREVCPDQHQRQRTRSSTSSVPNFRAPGGGHVFTYFGNDPTLNDRRREHYRKIVDRLASRQILVPRRVDWDLLQVMGMRNEIRAKLEKHAYDEEGSEYFICHAWERIFDFSETLYRELILEFVATFRFEEEKALDEFYQPCMSFRLSGVWHSISLVDLAVALGIYTQAEVEAPGFVEYMFASGKRPDDFDPSLSWAVLGSGNYGGNLKVKSLLSSSDRLYHQMLVNAVNARSSSEEKISTYDLWLLEQITTDDKYPNAPYIVAMQLMKGGGYREGSRMAGGQYVTRLARHYGVLTDDAIASMTSLGEMGLIDMEQLRGMGAAAVDHLVGGDQFTWIPYPQTHEPRKRTRSTQETGEASGANEDEQPTDEAGHSGYEDLSNRLSEMQLTYGRHHQHMEYNTTEALHQANWQSGLMNRMASQFGVTPATPFAASQFWPFSDDAPPGYPTFEDWHTAVYDSASGEIVRKLEKYKTGSFSDREVKVLAPPRLIFEKVPAFYQLSAAKMKFSAAKLAFALTRRFQNLPKIEGVGFLSVSRRERLLGERETASGPSFKYCSQPSVPYAFLDRKIQKKGQLYQLVSGLEGESRTSSNPPHNDIVDIRLKMLEEQNKAMLALLTKLPGAAVPIEVEPKTGFQASPYIDEIALVDIPKKYNIPAFTPKYSGISDPVEHIAQYKQLVWTVPIPTQFQEICMCKGFGSTLTGAALQWLINLKPKSIASWSELVNQFTRQFASSRKMEKQTSDLYYVVQKTGETIREYFNRFNAEMIEVKNCDVRTAIEAYKRGLDTSSELYTDLTKYPPENFDDVRARTLAHMRIEDDAIFRRKHSNDKKNLGAQKHDFKPKRVNKIDNSRRDQNKRSNQGKGKVRYPDLSTYHFVGTTKDLVDSLRNLEVNVRWPKKPENPSKDKDQTKWCDFHSDYGHNTDDCISLKKEIAYLKSNGHLKNLLGDDSKRPTSPVPTKVVNCITGGSEVYGLTYSAAKRHAREGPEGHPIPNESRTAKEKELDATKISFDIEDMSDAHQKHHDALVIQLTIGNCLTKRVLIDGGSSANVIFAETLKIMGIDRSNIVRRTTTLIGFNGDATSTLGEIILPVFAKGINKQTKFNVIDCPSAYNAILGRPWIHDMKAVPSTYHQKIKFPSPWGVQEIEHSDCFAWSHEDMVGIDPNIISHKLNVDPTFKPVKQKRRKFAPERNKVINEEVENLLKTGKNSRSKVSRLARQRGGSTKEEWKVATGHELLTFMDAYSGYNQILMHKDDQEKTAFMTDKGIYCYKVMPFGLKNAGSTYQRLVNRMFKDHLGRTMEVYIDDMLVKSERSQDHIQHLKQSFDILREYKMKLNPTKCSFGVHAGKFLGYMVTRRGIKASPEQIKAILEIQSPRNVKEVQKLTGRVAALNRFISRSSDKCHLFYNVLRKNKGFDWTEAHEEALQSLKKYMSNPPLLTKPIEGESLQLYLAVSNNAVSAVLVREGDQHQQPIYYISKSFLDAETRYTSMEKLLLGLVTAAKKLRHYFESHHIIVVTNYPLKIVLRKPELTGRLAKWSIYLSSFDLTYQPRTAIKSQALADFVAEFSPGIEEPSYDEISNVMIHDNEPWTMHVDGASNARGSGLGVVLKSSHGGNMVYSVRCEFKTTNNEAEYEALIAGLDMAYNLGARWLHVQSDSLLVVNQINGEFQAKDSKMILYLKIAKDKIARFDKFSIEQIPRDLNMQADALANLGSAFNEPTLESVPIIHLMSPTIEEVQMIEENHDWSSDIWNYLKNDQLPEDNNKSIKSFKRCTMENVETILGAEALLTESRGKGIIGLRYPQSNGLAESSNKTIINSIRKRLKAAKGRWVEELPSVLWANRTTPRTSTGQTPFSLVYGCEAVLPIESQVPVARHRTIEQNSIDLCYDIDALEELREKAFQKMASQKAMVERYFNKKVKIKVFQVGDHVLRRVFPNTQESNAGKLSIKWEGPYIITKIVGKGAYKISTIEGNEIPRSWNATHLK
ncbi:hypothetical protein OSB04_025378, partial [Centaurea solstitialis]